MKSNTREDGAAPSCTTNEMQAFIEHADREKPELKRSIGVICALLEKEQIPVRYIGSTIPKCFDRAAVKFRINYSSILCYGTVAEYSISFTDCGEEGQENEWNLSAGVKIGLHDRGYRWWRFGGEDHFDQKYRAIRRNFSDKTGLTAYCEGAVFDDRRNSWFIRMPEIKGNIYDPDDLAVYYHRLAEGVKELIRMIKGTETGPRISRVDSDAVIHFEIAFDEEIVFDFLDEKVPEVEWETCDREDYDESTRWR